MNKLIANFFSELISLVHILAIGGFCWYLIQEKPWQQGQSALIFTVLAFCGYVAVTGLLSTFIAMNENIVELKSTLDSFKSNEGSSLDVLLSELKNELGTQLETIATESLSISTSIQSIASDTSEISSRIESIASDTSEISSRIESIANETFDISLSMNSGAGSLNKAISQLSESTNDLSQSVSTLNQLLNQDWFRKLILK
jgi:methyl-accepting chemotaxis protein